MNENLVADKCEISNGCRLNVPAYIKDESGHYVKDSNGNYIKEEISKELFELLPEGFNHSTSIIRKSNFSPNPKRSVRKSNFHIKRSVLKTITTQQQECNLKGLHSWYLQID